MPRQVVHIEGLRELQAKLRRLGQAAAGALEEAAKAGGEEWQKAAQSKAPGPGIVMEVLTASPRRAEVGIGPDKEHWYYSFFELGVQPHTIKGSPLAFEVGGRTVFPRVVRHPGMPARPFLRPAADEKVEPAIKRAKDVLKRGIDRLTE